MTSDSGCQRRAPLRDRCTSGRESIASPTIVFMRPPLTRIWKTRISLRPPFIHPPTRRRARRDRPEPSDPDRDPSARDGWMRSPLLTPAVIRRHTSSKEALGAMGAGRSFKSSSGQLVRGTSLPGSWHLLRWRGESRSGNWNRLCGQVEAGCADRMEGSGDVD
jgi:hypothetical protein